MTKKNSIIVDIDSERTPIVQLGKMDGTVIPTNSEEAKAMIIVDMHTLCEGLITLIHAADQSGYKSIDESLKDCLKHIENGINNDSFTTKIIDIPPENDDSISDEK